MLKYFCEKDESPNLNISYRVLIYFGEHPLYKSWTDEEIEWLINNYPIEGMASSMKKLKRTRSSISCQITKLKIRLDPVIRKQIRVKSSSNANKNRSHINSKLFLKLNTPEIAYILGFLWADGYLYKNRVILEAVKNDLVNILNILESIGHWTKTERKRENWQRVMRMEFQCRDIYNFLIEMDYSDKSFKSADKILSRLDKKLHRYWFLGYFNGDGNLYVDQNHHTYRVSFGSGYKQDWTFLENLCQELRISYKIYKYENDKGHKSSALQINSSFIYPLLQYLYWDKNFIGLERKYQTYKENEDIISNIKRKIIIN